jgi:hypothetical protein
VFKKFRELQGMTPSSISHRKRRREKGSLYRFLVVSSHKLPEDRTETARTRTQDVVHLGSSQNFLFKAPGQGSREKTYSTIQSGPRTDLSITALTATNMDVLRSPLSGSRDVNKIFPLHRVRRGELTHSITLV